MDARSGPNGLTHLKSGALGAILLKTSPPVRTGERMAVRGCERSGAAAADDRSVGVRLVLVLVQLYDGAILLHEG